MLEEGNVVLYRERRILLRYQSSNMGAMGRSFSSLQNEVLNIRTPGYKVFKPDCCFRVQGDGELTLCGIQHGHNV